VPSRQSIVTVWASSVPGSTIVPVSVTVSSSAIVAEFKLSGEGPKLGATLATATIRSLASEPQSSSATLMWIGKLLAAPAGLLR